MFPFVGFFVCIYVLAVDYRGFNVQNKSRHFIISANFACLIFLAGLPQPVAELTDETGAAIEKVLPHVCASLLKLLKVIQ